MKQSLIEQDIQPIFSDLSIANQQFSERYPSDSADRQPVHTVYGGANLFKAGFLKKLGGLALKSLDVYAPNFVSFAKILGLPNADNLPESSLEIKNLQEALDKDPSGINALDKSAVSLSKTGSPKPIGTLRTTTEMIPPTLSPFF